MSSFVHPSKIFVWGAWILGELPTTDWFDAISRALLFRKFANVSLDFPGPAIAELSEQ
jgi:hypothetical protein